MSRVSLKNMTPRERRKNPMEWIYDNYAVIWATHPDGRINQVNFQYMFEAMNKVEEIWNSDLNLSLLKLERSAEYVS